MTNKKILLILVMAVAVGLFVSLRLWEFLTLEMLKSKRDWLAAYQSAHPVVTAALFVAAYVLQTALSLPGAAVMSLAAGALFGSLLGTVYSVAGATGGATLAFLVTRYLLHDLVQARLSHRLEGLNQEMEVRGLNYLLFLRLVPIFPFFLVNLAAGLTRLPLRTFVIGTFAGIIPGGFVIVNAGASLATITTSSGIASPRVVGSLVLLGLFALVPALYAKLTARGKDPGPGRHQE